MRIAVRSFRPKLAGLQFACAALSLVISQQALADDAFIQQAPKGASNQPVTYAYPTVSTPATSWTPRSGVMPPTPETAVPATGGNFASTLEVGRFNRVSQVQAGSGNISNVGIIKGSNNNVGVLQAGHSLKSNLLLVNTEGISVGVIQPNGSAPVNMLIARLPNGGLLIKR
jgi:hypothetical protein